MKTGLLCLAAYVYSLVLPYLCGWPFPGPALLFSVLLHSVPAVPLVVSVLVSKKGAVPIPFLLTCGCLTAFTILIYGGMGPLEDSGDAIALVVLIPPLLMFLGGVALAASLVLQYAVSRSSRGPQRRPRRARQPISHGRVVRPGAREPRGPDTDAGPSS